MNSQFQKSNLNILESLLFEVLERIAIFYLHLEETDVRFFSSRSLKPSEPHFVDSFNKCLSKILHCATAIVESIHNSDESQEYTTEAIQQVGTLISTIKVLHRSKLGHLPRPPEPPELKRFGRILKKHAVKLEELSRAGSGSDITIYLDEEIAETVFAGDPLVDFKSNDLNTIIERINTRMCNHDLGTIESFTQPTPENLGYHLTVPRIDATNPCRWPTLVHEVGHRIISDSFFKYGNIQREFEEFLSGDGISLSVATSTKYDLRHWLTECWCDLFGAIVIGPSFWFAQWSSFLFNLDEVSLFEGSDSHPPALFRLHLILKVLNHRFPDAVSPEFKHAAFELKKMLEVFDSRHPSGFIRDHDLRQLVHLFRDYFFRHFFRLEDDKLVLGENMLNASLASLIKYTGDIRASVVQSMVKSLADGCPIPAVPIPDLTTWRERASTVQEILLSAWIYRNTIFRAGALSKFNDILKRNSQNPSKMWDDYLDEVVKMFSTFNFSVLRSIQVSEWFHLFEGKDQELCEFILCKAKDEKEKDIEPSVLVDYQIFNLIKSQDIKVIPIMRLDKQLGATSLDIRLGTSFQVYSPNQVGVVDLTNNESIGNANANSTLVDLDYLESITIAPGQFMLGHTMEYICLPPSVAAQVEGRSSFARLGIEVHMTAGFVDPGFQGVLTFEIFNAGPNPVRLYPGIRIGQLRFFRGAAPGKPYSDKPAAKYRGFLQHRNSLQFNDYEVQLLTEAVKTKGN